MIPTIIPNIPIADPNISTIKTLTKVSGFAASAMARPDPDTPTHILKDKHKEIPAEEIA